MQTHKSARTAWPLFKTHGYFQLAKFKKLFLKFEITFFSKNHSESVCDCWRDRFFKKTLNLGPTGNLGREAPGGLGKPCPKSKQGLLEPPNWKNYMQLKMDHTTASKMC